MTKFDDAKAAGYVTIEEIPDELAEAIAALLGTTAVVVKSYNAVWTYDEDEHTLLFGDLTALDGTAQVVVDRADVQQAIDDYLGR